MLIRSFLLICVGLCFQLSSFAHLKLKVLDESKQPSVGVKIEITMLFNMKKKVLLTDVNGEAFLDVETYPIEVVLSGMTINTEKHTIAAPSKDSVVLFTTQNQNRLNEVVVTGLGRPTRLDEAVSLYSIITAEDIKQQGAHNLQDILKNELGISIGQDAMTGGTIKMQGLTGDNVKILVDGMPVNGREGQNIDLSTLNLNNVERIEIVQGPMSVMYGADAIGGVINLISKLNKKPFDLSINTYYETVGRYNADVSVSKKIDKHNFTLQGGRNYFEGWDPESKEKRNPLWRPKEQYFGHFKYHYPIHNFAGISFVSDFMRDQISIKGSDETFSYHNRNVRDEKYTSTRSMNRLRAYWRTGDSGYWESNNAYSIYHRDRESFFTDLSTMDKHLSTFEGDQSQSAFHNVTLRTTYNNQRGKFSYTFGYDINLEFSESAEKLQGDSKEISDYALLLMTEYQLSKVLKLQPGIRAAINTQYKVPILPSLSLLYKPNAHYQVRMSYGRGFRAPTLKEMYLDFKDTNHDIYGNDELHAEEGHHVQFSTGYTLYEEKSNFNNITFSVFYNNVKNLISLAQTSHAIQPGTPDPYTYINIGAFENLNLQLSSQNHYENIDIKLAVALNQNLKTVSYDAYRYWEASAQFGYFWERTSTKFLANYKYTGRSPMILTDVTGNVTIDDGIKTMAYHNLDISFMQPFLKDKLFLNIGVKNAFNNTIIPSSGTPNGQTSVIPGHGGASDGGLNVNTGISGFIGLQFKW